MARMLKSGLAVPWVTADGVVSWQSAGLPVHVCFDGAGISRWEQGHQVAEYPWSRVRDLEIEVPYSSRRTVLVLTVLSMISPKPFMFSSEGIEIRFAAGYEKVDWTLAPSGKFDWRIQFVLDDLMPLLGDDFSPLGVAGVLDKAAETVAPRIHRHARLLLYTDLLGLDRFVGGHTAFDSQLRAVIAGEPASS